MKKIGLLMLALVMALGALGIGYAKWSDTVTITGNVNSGSVCWTFTDPLTSIDPDDPPTIDWTCNPGFTNVRRLDKNVGNTTVSFTDPHHVQVTLNNTYPCYYNSISLHEISCGTIPVKLGVVKLTYIDPQTQLPVTVSVPHGTEAYIVGADQYGGYSNVIEVLWVDNDGAQFHQGQIAEDSLWIHVLQPAMQGATYSFNITREAIQWNEYPAN